MASVHPHEQYESCIAKFRDDTEAFGTGVTQHGLNNRYSKLVEIHALVLPARYPLRVLVSLKPQLTVEKHAFRSAQIGSSPLLALRIYHALRDVRVNRMHSLLPRS